MYIGPRDLRNPLLSFSFFSSAFQTIYSPLDMQCVDHDFVCICMLTVCTEDTVNNEAFAAINPNKRIPAIDDNGFILTER